MRGGKDSMAAMDTISRISCLFISTEEIHGDVIGQRIANKQIDVSFRSRAMQILQKTSVVSAFSMGSLKSFSQSSQESILDP